MACEHSNWIHSIFLYARACARSRHLKIAFILFLISGPAAAADRAFDASVAALKSADLKTKFDGLEKIKAFHTRAAAQALAQSAARERDANFRLAALDQIAALQISAVAPELAPCLRDKTAAIRQRAARVIGILGGPGAEAVLLTALPYESDPSVKAAMVQALGLCGSARSDAALNAAVSDADPSVRANAAHARKRIKGQRG